MKDIFGEVWLFLAALSLIIMAQRQIKISKLQGYDLIILHSTATELEIVRVCIQSYRIDLLAALGQFSSHKLRLPYSVLEHAFHNEEM